MLKRIFLALLLPLADLPHGTVAQTVSYSYETPVEGSGYENMPEGAYDVPCEYSYGPAFYSYYGVEFEDQMFRSE